MHHRSIYQHFTDFRQLAQDCPSFARHVNPETARVDFRDPDAVRELARSLLRRDFGIHVDLPEDRLCPMVPNRLNYILWIQDLLDSTSDDPTDAYHPEREVLGLDVGTGANVIYPLLGCAQRPSWRMVGTDIDETSLEYARSNVERNIRKLGDRIHVVQTAIDGPLFPLDHLGIERLDFTMCNPPFYESTASLLQHAAEKSLPASSACTGSMTEMVYVPQGELGFARRMLSESLQLGECVGWYTIMFGLLSNASALVAELKHLPQLAGNWAVTEFVQGKTKRWGVAWSFRDRRPAEMAARVKTPALHGALPFPSEFEIDTIGRGGVDAIAATVRVLVLGLDTLACEWSDAEKTAAVEVTGNVWARAARRAKARGQVEMADAVPKLGVVVKVMPAAVLVRWKLGRDSVLFESFCGMLKRKLQMG